MFKKKEEGKEEDFVKWDSDEIMTKLENMSKWEIFYLDARFHVLEFLKENFLPYRIKRRVKFFWQRRFRGFDDGELWNLDHRITEFILPRLKAYRDLPPMGYPGPAPGEDEQLPEGIKGGVTYEQWLETLDKMIEAMELSLTEINFDYSIKDKEERHNKWREENDEMARKIEEGRMLFCKYWSAIWD